MINYWVAMTEAFIDEFLAKWLPDNEVDAVDAVTYPVINQFNSRAVGVLITLQGGSTFPTDAGASLNSVYDPESSAYIASFLGALETVTSGDVKVGGSWDWYHGTPLSPQAPWLINFMPPVIIGYNDPPDNEDPIYGPATEVTDVILRFGQAPRSFS